MEDRTSKQGQLVKGCPCRRIVFFGDSNTYGYEPSEVMPGRYPAEVRWTDRLAEQLGGKWEVVSCGLNGRMIPDVRHAVQREPVSGALRECGKEGILAVMLGTNDLLLTSAPDAAIPTAKMDRLLAFLTKAKAPDELLLIAPPAEKQEKAGADLFLQQFLRENRRMNAAFGGLADLYGTHFIDAGEWDIPMAYDRVHLNPEGHRIFAEHMHTAITEIW